MLESIVIIGIVSIILYFIIYALYNQNIKAESDFAKDVYYYLVRRYPATKILDYGGISSDPIIESKDAGPFASLEVKVITNKQEGKTDRDLILRGVINKERFRHASNERLNLLVSPKITWSDPSSRIELGDRQFDQRFKISADNSIFVRNILLDTDVADMMKRNYDLEAYSLYWYQDGTTAIQVRMESMTSNSFLNAFNVALATVGLLNQRGYLLKSDSRESEPGTQSWAALSPTVHKTQYTTDQYAQVYTSEKSIQKSKELPKIKLHPERDLRKLKEKQAQQQSTQMSSLTKEKAAFIKKPSNTEKLVPLFTSIRYQAKDIKYLKDSVEIETFSSQLPAIQVSFPSPEQALIVGKTIQIPNQHFSLSISNSFDSSSPSWDNPWKNIEITGTQHIHDQIKQRTSIAYRIKELGKIKVDIRGTKNGIEYSVIGPKTKEAITTMYSFFLDLVWFLEMLV